MAKLKAPLMSLGATQQLGKALVFFPWKGLNVVREYVVPSNPKTALQTTQRGYVTAGVAMVHTAQADATEPLISADQIAYSALAAAKGKIMTWFNQAVKLWVDVKVAGNTPIIYASGTITDPDRTSLDMNIHIHEEVALTLVAGTFYFGSSKTNLIHAHAGWVNPAGVVGLTNEDISAWATAGVKYYVQFRPDVADPCEGADSGIYYFVAT